MAVIREFSSAKINLTLTVCGKRADGFHELASLTAFADVGDDVTFESGAPPTVRVGGPFAGALAGSENLLDRTLALLANDAPRLALGAVHLEKRLPVAAGIGGGSADAAALLRAVRAADPEEAASVDWRAIAGRLGADVPVCLERRALWMTGAGHGLAELVGGLPPLDVLLVNPMARVPADKTARVFRTLGAPPLAADWRAEPTPVFSDAEALLAFMQARGNDLEAAACAVVPEAQRVLDVLRADPDVRYAALSGAGPTSFAVVRDAAAAHRVRDRIAASSPTWWVAAAVLS